MTGLLKSKFAAALLSATAIMGTAQAEQPELPANAKDTITFRVKQHNIQDNHASLVVDASAIGDNRWKILTDKVTKAAILMPGMDSNRLCPYFDLAKRQYTIDQIEKGKFDFKIETEITPADARNAIDKKCLIIDIPSSRKINWK